MRPEIVVGSGEYEKLDEKTKTEIREMDSVLGDFFGLGMMMADYKRRGVLYEVGVGYGMGIVSLEDGSVCGWWYGDSLEDCFWNMMKDLKWGVMVGLPRFESVSELRMKLELLGMGENKTNLGGKYKLK